MLHAASTSAAALDLSDGETRAYVNDATIFLGNLLDTFVTDDAEVGSGGPADTAIALVSLLAGRLDDDAAAYTMNLLVAGAEALVASGNWADLV